ncbi:MAG: redox-sensing transcriptional repressor Rex [Chloroflexi bacterium]|nr:MAG: redox-sensing transcriptional repressor Rex [Chloroflexota bacterium]
MRSNTVPDIVVGRLPIYLRVLNYLIAEGRQITSSQELGDRLGISSAQIRKDLSHFGEFGKQGTGYDVVYLRDQLQKILKVDRTWPFILVGVGDLGHALARYHRFAKSGFKLVGLFDNDPQKIGTMVGDQVIRDVAEMEEVIKEHNVKLAIMAVPASAAREVADKLIECGITSILCYAPVTLLVPLGVRIQYIDPVARLQHMTYYQEVDDEE